MGTASDIGGNGSRLVSSRCRCDGGEELWSGAAVRISRGVQKILNDVAGGGLDGERSHCSRDGGFS